MPNQVLLNPSDIKGDISSCQTNVAIVTCASRNSLFYCNDRGYATNNCTGQTDVLNSWSITGFTYFSGTIIFLIIAAVIIGWINKD